MYTGSNHTPCLNHFQTFTRHSDTVRERKKSCITPCKIMTDNQNVNKTSMKDVQQQHFLFKRARRVAEVFPKTSFSFCLFVPFFWNKRAICLSNLSVEC